MITVAGINLTPVKSTALLRPDVIALHEGGAVGDRRFLFVRSDGTRLSGISKAPLVRVHAAYDPATRHLRLALPDGSVVEGDAAPQGDPLEVELFDRTVTARRTDPRFTAAVAGVLDDTLELVRVDEPEYAGGEHRVSILSRASVEDLARRGDADALDARRFRMLIEVDGCAPYEEDAWQGRHVRFGEAVVRVGDLMPRCAFTTLDPDTGAQDFPTLDVLALYRREGQGLLLGVYADVEESGTIRIGDEVEVLT